MHENAKELKRGVVRKKQTSPSRSKKYVEEEQDSK